MAICDVRPETLAWLLIRKSGTEPLIRVMGECEDEHLLEATMADVVVAVQAAG